MDGPECGSEIEKNGISFSHSTHCSHSHSSYVTERTAMAEVEGTTHVSLDIEGGQVKQPRTRRIISGLLTVVNARGKLHFFLLIFSMVSMLVGFTAGALLMRFYFASRGQRKWLSSALQTAGWPLLAAVIAVTYWKQGLKMTRLTPGLGTAYVLLGLLAGVDNYLFSWGAAYLSASTFGLVTASQLIFNAIFAMLITRQKITVFGWNSIVLVTAGSVILALHADNDRLPGVTRSQYMTGYVVTVAASALYGLFYPLTELVYKKFLAGKSNKVILEMQLWNAFMATLVATVGMGVNRDFEAMEREQNMFTGGGRSGYWMTLAGMAVAWQVGSVGAIGIICLSSSLLAGVVLTVGLPVLSISAVVFFHDKFGGLKIMSMILSLWGFVSYLYGGYVDANLPC